MPERSRIPRAALEYTLYQMHHDGMLIRATCNWCNITRYFHCDDLARLVGNVDIERLQASMRCEKCNQRQYMYCKPCIPTAAERMKITVRRIAAIKYVRKVVWRDEH